MNETIDYDIFNSDEYLLLLLEVSPTIKRVNDLDDDSIYFFKKYKTITPDNIEWDEEYAECVDIYFHSKFFYRVDNSEYIGVYTDDDGYSYIIKNYDGYFFDFVGDNLSNWVENYFKRVVVRNPEKIQKFKEECFNKFGIDPNNKYDN